MTENSSDNPRIYKKDRSAKFAMPRLSRSGVTAAITLLALIVGFLLLKTVWRTIRPGDVGILFDKSSQREAINILEPGWIFINPFKQGLQDYPITIQTYSMVRKGSERQEAEDDSIKVQSNEGQQLNLDVVIQYQVRRNLINQLYQDWGGASIDVVEDRVVGQYTRSRVPIIATQYSWEEISTLKRGEISQAIAQELRQEFQKRHLELISFSIPEVHLPVALQKALDAKIQAQQAAEQAQIKGVQEKLEAEGEAAAIKVRAKAQAEANELLSRSVTPDLIRSQQIDKWDGKLPVFSGNGIIPMLNSSDLFRGNEQSKPNKP